jgi:hypothetical protein
MSEAALLCDAFTASTLVSLALDNPEARRETALARLDALLNAALDEHARQAFSSSDSISVNGRKLPRSVLYRGLVLLMLAGRERLGPGSEWTPLFDALAHDLAGDLESTHWLPSFGKDHIWPCDHAPAASALALHGKLRSDPRSIKASATLIGRIEALRQGPGGFSTRVNADGKAIEGMPRGTAMAWTAAFLRHGAPDIADAFARDFVERFCERPLGMGACREWPKNVEGKADAASGPIVRGFGVGATALGLAAVHGLPGSDWFDLLSRTAQAGGIDKVLAHPEKAPLEVAIALWGRTARSWLP